MPHTAQLSLALPGRAQQGQEPPLCSTALLNPSLTGTKDLQALEVMLWRKSCRKAHKVLLGVA